MAVQLYEHGNWEKVSTLSTLQYLCKFFPVKVFDRVVKGSKNILAPGFVSFVIESFAVASIVALSTAVPFEWPQPAHGSKRVAKMRPFATLCNVETAFIRNIDSVCVMSATFGAKRL